MTAVPLDATRGALRLRVERRSTELSATEHVATEFEKIIEGDPSCDLFVRWKPLHEQPIGWEVDISGGIRVDVGPLLMARRFNAEAENHLHFTRGFKEEAPAPPKQQEMARR